MGAITVRCLSSLVVLLSALSLFAAPAQARREWQAFGGSGDASTKIECPAGQVMVGVEGRAGAWINAMRIVCAPLTGSFSTGGAQGFGGFLGGRPGGAQGSGTCPSDTVLTEIGFYLTPDKGKVVSISLECTRSNGAVSAIAGIGSEINPTEGCGKALGLFDQGCAPGEGQRTQSCPQEQFVGLTVHSGRDVNAIGAICDRRDPPPLPKPIKITGRPKVPAAAPPPAPAKPTGPPVALRTTISGSWKMTVGDQRGNLILGAQGSGLDPFSRDTLPLAISGQLINPDDDAASGGVQGVLEASRMLTLNYFRKNGTTGTCQLLYESDGKALRGSCVESGRTVEWGGFRGAWKPAAVAPVAASSPSAGGRSVVVKLDVDLYPAPGGAGEATGSLAAGTQGVTLVEPCKADWCHVRWPGHEGWVYSGSDYNSLGQ